jgi:hypothetical protein
MFENHPSLEIWSRVFLWSVASGLALSAGAHGERFPTEGTAEKARSRPQHACSRSESELCRSLDEAHSFFTRLSPAAARYVETVSSHFSLEASARIQQALLREDLVWQQKGLTPRQLDIMVLISLALSLEDAEALSLELRERATSAPDPHLEARLQRVDRFRQEAFALLQKLSADLGPVKDADLQFGF